MTRSVPVAVAQEETDTGLRVVIPQPGRTGVVGTARGWLPAANGPMQQCDQCSGWFGVTYWTCPACIALGYRVSIPVPTACDWCGQQDHDPIKPLDDD
ncbi:hypothetical protein ABZ547_34200 [Streptomyces sparsogenes]|uniref:hypothetical protein n=1 Tax=Streptomyces sparsogenes TaxID=67365 RepID=UPI0033E42083